MHRHALLFVLLATVPACRWSDAAGDEVERPADVDGTRETAARLAFRAHAAIERDGRVSLKMCVNTGEPCITAEHRIETCERYAGASADVDGVAVEQRDVGGWSQVPVFGPRYGCSFPIFELRDERAVAPGRGTRRLTVRVGGEPLDVVVEDWLAARTVRVPSGTLVKGQRAFVAVEPRLAVERDPKSQGTYFLFDDAKLNSDWVVTKLDLGPGSSGFTSEMADVDPASWTEDGFEVAVPADMPSGRGRFGFSESFARVSVARCPFAECVVTVNRSAEAPEIQVTDP